MPLYITVLNLKRGPKNFLVCYKLFTILLHSFYGVVSDAVCTWDYIM